jgi:hypothetical protein
LSAEEWSQLQKVHAEARERVKQGMTAPAGEEKAALKAAVEHLFERQSVLKRHNILAEALNQNLGSLDLTKLTAEVEAEKAGLIRLADDLRGSEGHASGGLQLICPPVRQWHMNCGWGDKRQ